MGVDLMKEFGSDADKEVEGVWHDVDWGDTKFSLKVAALGNPDYKLFVRKESLKKRYTMRSTNEKSIQALDSLHVVALAKTVLKDWKGINVDGLEDAPYSVQLGEQVLKLDRFRELVEELAGDFSAYQTDIDEAEEKN